MKKANTYEIDFVNEQIIVSKAFLKASATLGTPEYDDIQLLRKENPTFRFVKREISRKPGKKAYRNLNYNNMREFIIAKEGEESRMLSEFERVLRLSKSQSGPYAYVKKWFLHNFKDAFLNEAEQSEEIAL